MGFRSRPRIGARRIAGLRLPALERRYSSRLVVGLFALASGFLVIGLLSSIAVLTGDPSMFPSLGPTAFLMFFAPTDRASCPRNALSGHLIGCLAGYGALLAFGLADSGPALAGGFTWARAGAAALSLGLTGGAMAWLGVPHAPAGATTLIVSLGILARPWQIGVLMLSVGLVLALGLAINRLAGVDYPLWAPRRQPPDTASPRAEPPSGPAPR